MAGSMIGWFLRNPLIDEGLTFLLRADFNGPDLAAGEVPSSLDWPYVSVGGPLTVKQDDGQFLIENGQIGFVAQTTPNWGDQGFAGDGLAREEGLALFTRWATSSGDQMSLHWQYISGTPISPTQSDLGIWTRSNLFRESQSILTVSDTDPDSLSEIATAAILRRDGGYLLQREGSTGAWKLLWVLEDASNFDTLYPALSNYTRVGTLDLFRAAKLPGTKGDTQPGNGFDVWGHRDLDLTFSEVNPISQDTTWTATPDFILKWTCPNPLSGDVGPDFRVVDDTHKWYLKVRDNGSVTLYYYDGGATGVANASAGSVSAGDDVVLLCHDETIKVFAAGALVINYTDASLYKTATGGLWRGGNCTDLTVRTLDGIANVGSPNHPGYGIATTILPSPYPPGTTGVSFTHESDCVIRWTQNTQYAANVYIRFRKQDDNNYLRLQVYDANLNLHEYVDGSPTYLAGGTGITAGKKITVMADGATISAWAGTTLLFTYPTATHFQTATAGEINFVGTGQLISNPIAWPRTFASAPNTPGAARALIALKRLEA